MTKKKHGRPHPTEPVTYYERKSGDPKFLLGRVAAALTACEEAGLRVKFSHGAVITREGYVLPLGDGTWGARTLLYTEFSPPADGVDD